jgi:DNA-binding NarL/FixJ family response regulator
LVTGAGRARGRRAAAFTNALIADELRIRERTVEFHASAIFDKAGVESRTMLVARLHML